ncbi:hypothetical protein MMC07_003221 [Pseudocyphellaria aurata]|nr:hypothetical protein [Pseudocyphellaria aurata]
MADLELTLSWLDMSQYLERFLQAGFDSWETVLEITEEDLEVLNVDLGHRRKLQREIVNTRRLANDPAFVVPLYPTLQGQGGHEMGGSFTLSNVDTHAAGQGKRSYRHHPKPDPNAPQRPYSAYVLFSNNMREELRSEGLSFTEMSRRVGERWQSLKPEEKEYWKQQAALPWESYKLELSEYQQSNSCKEHAKYLANFKRAQSAKKAGEGASHQIEVVLDERVVLVLRLLEARAASVSAMLVSHVGRERQGVLEKGQPARIASILILPVLLANLWKKVTAYESLLLRVLGQLDVEDQSTIQKCLLMPPQVEGAKDSSMMSQSPGSELAGEDEASGVGSMGSTDIANEENFRRYGAETHSEAFIGNASEEKWLQRLETELSESDVNESKPRVCPPMDLAGSKGGYPRTDKSDSYPYPEDMDTSVIGSQIDPYGLPVKSAANALVNTYFTTIHPSFPIIDQSFFSHQFEEYFTMSENETFKDHSFITTLQIVFAISAVHAHRTGAEWAGDDRDHLLYFARAQVLGMKIGMLSETVNHGQVQVFGLSGMYFMVTDQINRAWTTLALAIRCAQALGMHLQNTTPSLSDAAKEFRAHIWHAIVSLERVMTVMTSRPSMIHDRDCSVSLSSLTSQDQALTDRTPESTSRGFGRRAPSPLTSYFRHYVEINALAQLVVSRLYNPDARHLKWSQIQQRILELDEKLVEWACNLPKTFNVQGPFPSNAARSKEPLQKSLGMLFYSTRTIIHRPSLCRLDRLIARQSDTSLTANRDMANKCVHSAQAMLAILPDEPELDTIYAGQLWWMIHRHIKRAGTVLLLELAFRARHMPSQSDQLLADAKKAVRWLRAMAQTSLPAEQSWIALSLLLKRAGQRVGGDTTDVIDPLNIQRQEQQRQRRRQSPVHRQQQQRSQPVHRGTTQLIANVPAPTEAWQPLDDAYSRDPQMPGRFFGDLETLELDQFGFPQAGAGTANLFPTTSEMHEMSADGDEDGLLEKEEEQEQEEEGRGLGGGDDEDEDNDDEDDDEEMGHAEDVDPLWYDWRAGTDT